MKIEVIDYDGIFNDGWKAIIKAGKLVGWEGMPVF